jgi:hypothetical protein
MLSKTKPGLSLELNEEHFMHEMYDMNYFYKCCLKNIHELLIGLLDRIKYDVMLFMM